MALKTKTVELSGGQTFTIKQCSHATFKGVRALCLDALSRSSADVASLGVAFFSAGANPAKDALPSDEAIRRESEETGQPFQLLKLEKMEAARNVAAGAQLDFLNDSEAMSAFGNRAAEVFRRILEDADGVADLILRECVEGEVSEDDLSFRDMAQLLSEVIEFSEFREGLAMLGKSLANVVNVPGLAGEAKKAGKAAASRKLRGGE